MEFYHTLHPFGNIRCFDFLDVFVFIMSLDVVYSLHLKKKNMIVVLNLDMRLSGSKLESYSLVSCNLDF